MATEIRKGSGPGTWRPVRGASSARLTCPRRGHDAEIDQAIGWNGTLAQRLACPTGCGFDDYVRLLGWRERLSPDYLPGSLRRAR